MTIYDFYKDTYKKLNDTVALSKYLSDEQVNEFNSCCDVCKTIDKNMILLSMNSQNTYYMDDIKQNAYTQICDIVNKHILNNDGFIEELTEELANYNISINNDLELVKNGKHIGEFALKLSNIYVATFSSTEVYNILNNTVLNFTNSIYRKLYKNEVISDTFNYFKDLTIAGIHLCRGGCIIRPNMNKNDIYIELRFEKIFNGK